MTPRPAQTATKISPSGATPMDLGQLSGEPGTHSDAESDAELMAFGKGKGKGTPRQFNGQCYHCNQRGHRAAECPSRTSSGKGGWTGKGGGKSYGKTGSQNWGPPGAANTPGHAKGGKGNWIWQPAHSLEHADPHAEHAEQGPSATTLFL